MTRQVFTKDKNTSIWLPVRSTDAPATILYQNSDGNITDWNLLYNYGSSANLEQISGAQRISIYRTGGSVAAHVRYSYNGAGAVSWTDYSLTFVIGTIPASDTKWHCFVRWDGSSTGDLNSYHIRHIYSSAQFTVKDAGNGDFTNIIVNNAVAISSGNIIKVEVYGYNPSTVKIYVNGTLYWHGETSTNQRSAGTIGRGIETTAMYSYRYDYWDDLLVESI